MPGLKILVFNKKRRLQLDAFLRSLKLHSGMAAVVYSLDCASLKHGEFKRDILEIIDGSEYVMFCVDDTIFLSDFDVEQIQQLLKKHKKAIGFSLRLGRNTKYCYTKDRNQKVPEFEKVNGCLKYEWIASDLDFGYPLEISSSIYRRDDIVKILNRVYFRNPTTLEIALHKNRYVLNKPYLLCYPKSVAVSVPWNVVQTQSPNNRCGNRTEESLEKLYKAGVRINIEAYADMTTNAAHQELPLMLRAEGGLG